MMLRTRLSLAMNKVDVHKAKIQFSRLVKLAAAGEEIIIAKSGKPVARLVPYEKKGAMRRPGAMRGKIRIKKNFDELLPKELLTSFEGKS
jgi:prevent-host-death family protein